MVSTRNTLTLFTAAFLATTANAQNVYFGTGGPIIDGGVGCGDPVAPPTVFGDITIAGETGAEIESVELIGLRHMWVGALEITLDGPGGFTTRLLDRPGATGSGCGSSSDFISSNTYEWSNDGVLFSEQPPNPIPSGDFFPTGESGVPSKALPTGDLNGTWTLTIKDMVGSDTGAMDAWSITVTPEPSTLALLAVGGLTMVCRRGGSRFRNEGAKRCN